ncbi:hypothetical protein E3N86_00075 [Cryobacterium sp. Hz7]|uniref:hypothetical protein n=1 Tax=Cryobacterium sp. Hz7 TaxID=1259166 RepID=UPI00106BC584|nr:hypothetical protein [Cryobacterium sp. Hz7]TFB67206.1 hypothetical protein E3N86_00075 [Cryobacterium sp. Hz7]
MFTAIATSIAAATDLSAFGAGDVFGFLLLAGMVIAIVGAVVQDEAAGLRKFAGAAFVVVGLLVIIAGYTGAVAADNLPAASSSSSSTVR